MRLIITNKVEHWVATYVKEKLKLQANKKFVLGLPTGSTAILLYEKLLQFYKNQEISFKHVSTFNMDEYIKLDKNNPHSYWFFMHQHFFNHIDIDPTNINIPNGNAPDIKAECRLYEEKIKKAGGIDLFIGGVGENGHLAFNEPYSSLSSKTRDKELNHNTILANARFFNNDVASVPKSAITVGIDTLMAAGEVVIMIKGVKKALALHHALEKGVSHLWPISILQFHKKAIIVADEGACLELKVKTYKYFKELQDEYSVIESLIT